MDKYNKKSVSDSLRKYNVYAKDSDFIEVTEWHNGEGWDITINDRTIQLSCGHLEAINYLIKVLDYEEK